MGVAAEPELHQLSRPIDATAMGAYNRCPRLYDFSMRQHRRKPGKESPALCYGTGWHVIMDHHHRSDGDPIVVRMEAEAAWEGSDHADDYRTLSRALLEYDNYLKKYGKPSANKREKTYGWPENPLLEIPCNIVADELIYPYAGRIDRIFEEDGLIYVEDYKTTSRFETGWLDKYKISQQMMGYAWIAGKLIGKPVAGVRIDLHVVRKNDSQFERGTVTFSPARLEEWVENTNNTFRDILRSYETGNFRGVYTEGGCAGKFGMCSFVEVCKLRPGLRQQHLEMNYIVEPWDPLSAVSEMPSD